MEEDVRRSMMVREKRKERKRMGARMVRDRRESLDEEVRVGDDDVGERRRVCCCS